MDIDFSVSKILLTGGAGFLGGHIHKKLLERGVPGENIHIPKVGECDLRAFENCLIAVRSKDIVIHAAGVTGGGEFHAKNPGEIFYDNLIMGVHLMEAARLNGVKKFISIGSAAEYPANAPSPMKEEYLWQGFPGELHASYAFAKLMLLTQGQAYKAQYGFNAIHLIMANMYGPGDSLISRYVIPSLIEKISKAQKENLPFIEVWGTGAAKRDFLYVEDAAEAIIRALQEYNKPEPVNMGSGTEVSVRELVDRICALMGFKGEIRWDSSRPEGQLRRLLDASGAYKEFGFRAATSLEEGLIKTIAWHKQANPIFQ